VCTCVCVFQYMLRGRSGEIVAIHLLSASHLMTAEAEEDIREH